MKISGQDKDRAAAAVFYTAFMIEMLIFLVDQSDFLNPFEGRLFQITFLLFGFKVFMTRYSAREWILIFAFGVLGGISYFVTDRNEIIRVVMMVAASKNINSRGILKLAFFTLLSGAVLIMGLSIFGIYGNQVVTAEFGRGGIESRYCFGFGHPNALHCVLWSLLLQGMYLYRERMKWYVFLLLFLVNIGLGVLTASRAGIIIVALTIAAGLLVKYVEKLRDCRILYAVSILILAGAVIFSLVAAVSGTDIKLIAFIDKFLNNRILISHEMGGMAKWSLLGAPGNLGYFDMGFIRLFYWYGILFGILYVLINLLMINYFYKSKNGMALVMIGVWSIYTVVEAYTISVYMPRNYIFLLLLGGWEFMFHANGGVCRYVWQLLYRKQK